MATKKKANWNKEVRTTTDEEKQAWQYKGKDKDVATYDAKKMLEAWKQKVNSKEFDEYVKAETAYQEYQRKLKEVKSKLTETGSTSYEDYYQRQLKANKQATNALNWESFKRTLGDKLGFRADSYDEALKTKQASDEALSYATQYRHADAYQDANFKTKSAKGLQAAADDLAVYNTEMGKGRVGGKTWSDWISNTDTDLMVRLSGNDVTTYMPTDSWTDDQRELFGYYYATDKEKAIELGSSINRQAENAADKAAQEALAKEYGNASTLGKIGYGAASIVAGASPLGVKDYAYNALGYIGNGSNWVGMEGLTDTQVINGIDSAISESLNAQSGTINESVPILGGKGAGDAYQLGKSILDSIITARVSSGITKAALKNGATEKAAEWAGKAITYGVFFGNAAAQSYDDAMQRGATPGQAVYLGLADGVAEALFEEFSIEQLIRIGDSATLKELAINILKQNVTEGSEELFTSIANTISDALIMQQNSSQQQKIDELVAQGYSYKDAYKIAVKDTVGGIIYDALAGAVSGGISGSIYGGINYAVNNSTARYADGSKVNATDFYNMSGEVAGENTADVIAKVQSENKGRKSDTLTRGQVSRIRETWDADKYAAKVSETQAKVDEAKAKLTAAVQNNAEAVDNVNSLMSEGARRESQSKPVMAGQSIELEGQKLTTAENNTFSVRGGSLYLNATTENGEEAYIDLNNKSVLESLPADVQSAVEYARTLFGDQAHIVLNAYDASMPIETYMTAMDTAVNMYEANGMDVEKASNMSLTRALSTAQVQAAKRVGLIASEAGINAAETAAAKFKTARAALEAKQAEGTATIKDFNSTIRSIRGMLKTERSQLETVNRQLANAEQGSEQYKALESKKARLEAEITGNERAIEQMQAEAQRIKDERRIDSKVSTDGGTVYENGEKIELKAVDTSKLSDKQKRMVDFVNKLSGIFELDFVLFDGDAKGAQGAYTGGGTIYVNINAGLAANKTLIAQAISHELTHYMQAYAPAEYAELKKYVQNKYLELNATEFEQLVRDRMEAGKLTEAKAIDEIVANACEEMLFDSRAIRKLAAENMTLAEKIRDFLKDMRQRLEDAFGDKDDIRREAVFAREFKEQLADMQELWDKGIYEAVHNRRAENAKPRPAAVPSMSVEDYESVTRAGYDSIGALTDEGMEEVANAAARAGALNDKLQEIKSNPQYQTWYETSREARRELTALDEAYENNDAKYIDSQVASGKIHADVGERLKTIAQLRQDVFAYLETMPEYRAFKNEPGYMWEDEFAGLFDWDFDPYSADAGNGDAVAQLLNSFMTDELEQLSGRKAERFKVQGYKLLEFMVEGMDALDKERWGYTFADKNWNKDFAKWYEARHPYNEVPLSDYAMSTAEAEEIGEDGLRFQSWEEEKPIEQVGSSAATSLNQLPALFNLVAKRNGFESGTVNIDVGGGKYEQATDYLKTLGVRNRVFDPFNRSEENNRDILNWLMEGNKADTVTCANVLNVIDSAGARANVILETAKALKDDGSAYFIVYEGDKSGNGRVSQVNKKTGDMSWQEHRKTASYVTEIEQYFDGVEVHGKLIVAESPKRNLPKAMWETSFGNATRWQVWDELTPAQKKNYEYNQRQTETGSSLKTLNGSTISRYKNKVGKMMDALYIHKNYVDQIDIPEFKENLAEAERILAETYPEYEYRCIKYAPKKNTIAFQSAPDFDTAREPRVGDYVTVNYQTGTAAWSDRGGNYIWHHKWNWVMNDYKGFDVRESWEWSREWLNTLRETSDGNGIQRWNAQLDKYGLPKDGNAVQFQSWDQPENGKAIRKVLAGSMFSGGGTVDFALSAIIDSQFAVEYNPKISAVFRQNNETTYMGQDATKFDPRAIKGKVEYFHASPECKTDSNMISTAAKADRIGKGIDIDSAEAVVRVIDEKEPDAFTLENVPGYKDTEAMQIITDALDGHGYVYDVNTYDAADYGAATSRKRIFLRALRNGQLPALPEKVSRRTSWGEAAGDLLESLPEAKTVNPRMVNSLLNISGIDVDAIEQPLLVFGESYKNGEFGHAYYDETMPTLIANSGASRVFMPDGRVLEATPRLLARISGLPDDYKLPSDKVTARKIIGNGVPVKLTQAVAGGLLNGMTGQSVQFQTWDGEELQKLADEDKPMTATQEVQYSTWADKDFMDKAENKLIKDKKFKASVIGQRGQAAYDSLIEDMKGARSAREAVKKLLRDPNLVDSLRLPPDVMGNTLITNSSYGGTEENRPVCVRSLGAQALLDLVSDYFNRPLTVNETLQISEEIMATANKPECIYCYVAQDRRAYREFLGEYVKQRNAAIKDLKDGLNYDTAYKDYLNGRDDTDNSAHRFALFQKIADGELKPIAEKDLANLDRLLSEASSLKADIIEYAAKMTGRAEKKLSIVSNGGTQTVKYNTNSKKESNEFLVTVDELLNEPAIADKAARFIQLADAMAYAQSASWAKKMTPYAAYNGHILKMKSDRVDFLNDHYGLRMYSFSDFSPAFILENMQMITDAAVKGLKVLAYTKELDFVKIFADTGANINISVFAAHAIPEDRNSAVIPDGMMGADWNEAIALREKYPNVGLTLVATDDEIIEWAKTSDYGKYVDVIIPFHIVRTGEETAQFFNYINFTKESADKGLLDSKYYEENNIPKTVYPSEHNNEFKTYMEFVNERHLTPRFARYINGYEAYLDGEISLDDLVNLNSDGFYMKFVNETRRSANDTPAVRAYWTDENLKVAESSIRQMAKDGGYGAYGPYAIGGKTERAQQKNAERIIRKLESNGSERVPESGTLQLQKWDNDHPDLLAVHNVTEEKLLAAIKLGGLPMPSLAIIRADDGHTNYGGISLVFGKDSIDPQINRNNKIYGADAYTPTKVDLEYPVVSKVEFAVDNEIRDLAAKVADGIFSGGALNHAINYWGTSYLNLDQIADKLSRVDAVKAAYAAEHGVEIEPVMMNTKYHALGNDFLKKYIDFIGHQKLAQLAAETLANYKINDDDLSILTEFIAENVNPDNPKLAQARARMYREQDKYVKLIRSAWKMYEENGYGATEIDKLATLEELKSKVSDADAKKWIRGKIDGLLGEPGIWNGKEAYDEYSGERLPFNKTHMPYTLNNIIKAMRAANRERGSGVTVGATHLQSITAKEYKNMADVKADSFRIGTVDEAEYSARVGAVDNMLTEVVADIADSNNLDRSNVGADVIECARVVGAGSAESIRKYFRDTAKTPITKAQAEKLAEVYYESSILPTGYFEAKPYRAMGFDEVLAAVIPDTTSAEVKRALADNGVEMLTYKNEDDADRLAKLNSVEGARFQKWDDGTRKSKGIIVDEQEALTRLKSENYQLEEMVKQLTKERDKARKEAAESGRQLTITRSNEVRKSDSDKLTNRYIKEMGYTGTAEEKAQLRDAMKDLGDYVVNATGETVDYGVLKSKARAIAGELVRNASVFLDEGRTEEIGIRDHMDNLYKELTRRTYRLSKQDVGEIEAQYGSLKNFRDKYFGRFFISETKGESIDSIYSELRGDMGADRETFREYLPEANNPGEMLLNIAAAVDRVERVYGNPYDGNIEESTEAQANEIIFDVISDEVRQALPTFADVKEAQIEATRAKGAAKARKAYELGVARLNALRDEKNARITQVRQQGIASKKAAVAKEKALKWEAVAKERDYWRNRIAEANAQRNESTAVKKYLKRIKKDVADLIEWSVKPSNKDIRKHVPAEIQSAVRDFVLSIDMSSKRLLSGGEETQSDRAVAKAMEKMRRILDSKVNTGEIYSGRYDLPSNFIEEFGKLTDAVNELTSKGKGGYVLNAMSSTELRELSDTLKVLKKLITDMNVLHNNQMFAHDYEAGENSTKFIEKLGEAQPHKAEGVYKFMGFDNMRPIYVFDRFGEGGQSIFNEFVEAQAKLAKLTNEIIRFRDNNYDAEKAQKWAEEMHEFEVHGETIKMSTAQLMSLYCLNRREQGKTHIFGEGFRVANTKVSKKNKLGIVTSSYTYRDAGHQITQEDIGKMLEALTPDQIKVAEAMQEFMSTTCSGWGNEVTRIRFDVDGFTEPYYFPINSDGRILPANADEMPSNASLYALLNAGFTKELKENANNRIILYNIFDVFANHTASMAQYRAFALPVLDALKWFNYANEDTSLRDEMAKAFGAPEEKSGSGSKGYAESFVINFIKAVNGTAVQGDPYDGMMMSLLHSYNRAAIAFNGRVVIQQPMAITRAAMFLKTADLIEGMKKSLASKWKLAEEMESYSGMAQWKALGFYDTNVSRGLTDMISFRESLGEKVTELGTSWAEKADRLTWAAIWYAAKQSVNRADYGTEAEYFDAVVQVFENVIVRSQVVDSIVTKSEFMRAKGFVARSFGSFMGEPTTTISMLSDAGFRYELDVQSGMTGRDAFKKNSKYIKATIANYVVSQALLAVVQSIYDAWRDDDEYKTWLEKYLEALKGNLISELNPLGKIPYVKDLIEVTKEVLRAFGADTYGNVNNGILGTISEYTVKIAQMVAEMMSEDGSNYTGWALLYKCLQLGSATTGLPMAQIYREARDLWNNTVGKWAHMPIKHYDGGAQNEVKWAYQDGNLTEEEAVEELLTKTDDSGNPLVESREEALKLIYGWGTKGSSYDAIKKEVESGTQASFEAVKNDMLEHGYGEDAINNTVKNYIKELYTDSSKSFGKTDAVAALTDYVGYDAKTANDVVSWWWADKEYGMQIDADGNGSVKMDELGDVLNQLIRKGEIDSTQAQSIWHGCNPKWKTSYADWKKKQSK